MFNYKFPVITDIEQVRSAIVGRPEFKETVKGDYIVFNYHVNFEDTFPPVVGTFSGGSSAFMEPAFYDMDAAIRRECRGIIFDGKTGKLIRRPYHKFFNLNERVETRFENIDFIKDANVILEKLDGSMIAPFRLIGSNEILWGTKMGETDISEMVKYFIYGQMENTKRNAFLNFISTLLDTGHTPIFEFCSRKNRVVVDHPFDRLVLTAVRHMETGIYWPILDIMHLEASLGFETVGFYYQLTIPDMLKTMESSLEGIEGYVVRFEESGHMVKVKGTWYCQLHKTLEHIQHEKDLIRLILDDRLDDAKPFLPSDLVAKLDTFATALYGNMQGYADYLAWSVIEDADNSGGSKKEFAAITEIKEEAGLRFKLFDIMNKNSEIEPDNLVDRAFLMIKDKVERNLTSQTRVNSVRHLFLGLTWEI